MLISDWHMHFVMGFLVLVTLAAHRFSHPTWLRSYTTAERYHLALILYLASQVIVYYLLSAFLLAMTLRLGGKVPLWVSPVIIALGLAVVVPVVPVAKLVESLPRRWARHLGGIPFAVHRFARDLASSPYAAPEETIPDVKSALGSRGLATEPSVLPGARSVARRLVETACLFHQVQRWESDPRFAEFVAESQQEFSALAGQFDRLTLRIPRAFGSIERFSTSTLRLLRSQVPTPEASRDSGAREVLSRGIRELMFDLREELEAFRGSLCLYVARGVFSVENTRSARRRRVRELGFEVDTMNGHPATVMLQSFGIFVACLFVSFGVLGSGSEGLSTLAMATKVVMIATIQVTALALAIIPKTQYGFANSALDGTPPYVFLILVGVVAALCALPISVVFKSLIYKDVALAVSQVEVSYPWLLMSWFTATATAWLVQDGRWMRMTRQARWHHLLDAAVIAVGMTLSFVLVREELLRIDASNVPPPAMAIATMVIGALIGYLVPGEFRSAPGGLPSSGEAARPRLPRMSGVPSAGSV